MNYKNRIKDFLEPQSVTTPLEATPVEDDVDVEIHHDAEDRCNAAQRWLLVVAAAMTETFGLKTGSLAIGMGILGDETPGLVQPWLGCQRVLVNVKRLAEATNEDIHEVAGVLLLMLLRCEQHFLSDGPTGGVCDKALRKRAFDLGLLVNAEGSIGFREGDNPLFRLLQGQGIPTPKLRDPRLPKPQKPRRVRWYFCACDEPRSIGSKRRLERVLCPVCGEHFHQA